MNHKIRANVALPSVALLLATLALPLADIHGCRAAETAVEKPADFAGPYVRKPMFVIEEHQLVLPGKQKEVVDYYFKKVVPVLRTFPGYIGMAVLNPRPDPSRFKDPKIAEISTIPENPIQPHEGIMMDGKIRTDRSIVFHSMIRNSFNLVYYHYIADEQTLKDLIDHKVLGARWRKMYGTDFWDTLAKEYFSNMQNHYDVVYTYEAVD